MLSRRRAVAVLVPGLTTCFAATTATADVVEATWIDGQNYSYEIVHMPDLDQKRSGLPDDGDMYCVPTASMNMIMYIASHGFPEVEPGPGNWQAADNFDLATTAVGFMGLFMNTDPDDGTGGTGWRDGIDTWLDLDKFTISQQWTTSTFSPRQELVSAVGITGGLVSYIFGRYTVNGFLGGGWLLTRTSGHCVTLAKSERTPASATMWVRNPSNSSDLATQAPFENSQHDVDAVPVNRSGNIVLMSRLNWGGTGQFRLIDSYLAIRPKFGYSFTENGIAVLNPWVLDGGFGAASYTVPGDGPVLEFVGDPDGIGFLVLRGATESKRGSIDFLSPLSDMSLELINPVDMALERDRTIFVIDRLGTGDLLKRFRIDDGAAIDSAPIEPGCVSVMVIPELDRVMLVSADPRILYVYETANLHAPAQIIEIPDGVPLGGDVDAAVDPSDRKLWIVSSDSDKLYGVDWISGTPFETLEDSALVEPSSVHFDDQGHLFASAQGRVLEYARACPDCAWERVVDSAFAGVPVGPEFRVSRSTTNFDPAQHTGPGFVNTPTDELDDVPGIPDCFGDVDGDGAVGLPELLGVLAAWGSDDWRYDIAPDGGDLVVDTADLLAVLSAWGPCP